VEGQRVAAGALDHAAAAPAGREAVRKHVDQAHRRGTVAPARVPLLVAVVVPAQVQPRARAELEQAERQPGLARDEQKAAEARASASCPASTAHAGPPASTSAAACSSSVV